MRKIKREYAIVVLFLFSLASDAARGQANDLTNLNLADLMNIEVTSVSKKEQKLSRTASAVFVISQEDIRRSGALNIPDLLRMVPGLNVAQIDTGNWAVSARGLNGRFSNELLVLLDGRNVYTPSYGGVTWDVLDLPLEDIEQIEVIRGPGGTIWGANAVNGVINIISKRASSTLGGMEVTGGGNLNQVFGTVQYGGILRRGTDYRAFAKYLDESDLPAPIGMNNKAKGMHVMRGGIRTDSTLSPKDTLTLRGDFYTGIEATVAPYLETITSPQPTTVDATVPVSGGYIESTWSHTISARSDTVLQVSLDGYKRNDALMETRKTFDIDFKHHVAWGARQDIVWGGNYRDTVSDTKGDLTISLNPADLNMQMFSMFIQDEITLIPDRLYLTAGARLDHNYYTGFNTLPGGRVAWTPDESQMFWGAISRAMRTPTEIDTARVINLGGFIGEGGTPTVLALLGNSHFNNETLTAFESGYRTTISNYVSFDLSAYYNDYGSQSTTEPETPFFETTPGPPHLVIPLTYKNLMHGEAHGFETAVNWKPTDHWTLSPSYGFEQIHMHLDPTSRDTVSVANAQGSSPVQSAQLKSHFDMTHGFAWDGSASFVDRLKSGNVPSYTRLDTGLTWRKAEHISLSVVGQNLLKDRHLEFVDNIQSVFPTQIKRNVYAKATWQF